LWLWGLGLMLCPCKDCEKKGCGNYHSQCKEYLEYKKWKQQVNKKEREEKMFYVSIAKRRNKWKKKN
jgi:hypothetical protein